VRGNGEGEEIYKSSAILEKERKLWNKSFAVVAANV